MIFGKRVVDDTEEVERELDPEFARLSSEYGEWDEENERMFLHVYGKIHPDEEDYIRARRMLRELTKNLREDGQVGIHTGMFGLRPPGE